MATVKLALFASVTASNAGIRMTLIRYGENGGESLHDATNVRASRFCACCGSSIAAMVAVRVWKPM